MQLHISKHCPHKISHHSGTLEKHTWHSRKELIPGLTEVKVWSASGQNFPQWQTMGKEASVNGYAISVYGNGIHIP